MTSYDSYVSIMCRDHIIGTYLSWWVFVNLAPSRETILGPATIAPTGDDALDLARVDRDLLSANIVRTGEWNVTEYGYTAWVDFGDDSRRVEAGVPAGSLALIRALQ